jgi:hypothetical protein
MISDFDIYISASITKNKKNKKADNNFWNAEYIANNI